MSDANRERAIEGFVAGQNAAFREQVILWACDESITDEEFGRLVTDLGFRSVMYRVYFRGFIGTIEGVDASQPDDVE